MKIRGIKIYSLFLLFILASGISRAADSTTFAVDTLRFEKRIHDIIEIGTSKKPVTDPTELLNIKYSRIPFQKTHPNLPSSLLEEYMILRFQLQNNGLKEITFYLCPGYYVRHLRLFKADPAQPATTIKELAADENTLERYPGFFLLKLAPGEKAIFFTSMHFIRTNANNYLPCIIEKDYVGSYQKNIRYRDASLDTITYVIAGILLFMIIYSLAVYLQNKGTEFIYYSIYAICCTVMLFFKSFAITINGELNFVYEEYLDFLILGIGVLFYLLFVRKFLNTQKEHPRLDTFLRSSEIILLLLLIGFTYLYFFTIGYTAIYILENYIIKVFMFLIGMVFIVYSLRKKNKLLYYLAAGNFSLIFFSMLSLWVVIGFRIMPSQRSSLLNRGMLWYEIGIVLELMFFLSGLAYKNRMDLTERVRESERLKLENERKEFEKQLAIATTRQEERDRISADMHDELGSGMTAIRLMSEIAKNKMKDHPFLELEKISNSANDLLGKMNSIIWTMKSSNDSLESLVAYLRSHALEYFENTPIHCQVFTPEHIPSIIVNGEKRRNIFLSVKESLNNILKHAHATTVSIDIRFEKDILYITVKDNGIGIDTEKLRRFGNGMSNMKRRMESISGELEISTNKGTCLRFIAPL